LNKKSTHKIVESVASTLVILMITLALTSTLTTLQVYAHPATRAYVNPPKVVYDMTNGTVGTLFNLTVRVEGVDDMKTWQVKVYFNDSIINVTRWYEPTWDPTYVFYGKGTLPVPAPPKVAYGPGGWAGVGSALFPAPSEPGGGFTGNGLLCIIQFNVTATPPEGQTYSCAFNITSPQETFWVKVGELVKRPFDTYNDGEYLFILELSPLMILSILMVTTILAMALARKRLRKI